MYAELVVTLVALIVAIIWWYWDDPAAAAPGWPAWDYRYEDGGWSDADWEEWEQWYYGQWPAEPETEPEV